MNYSSLLSLTATSALVLGACQYVLKTTPIGEIVSKIRKIVG